MKKLMIIALCFCMCGDFPKTTQGQNPYDVNVPYGKMVLVDMGYVDGTIEGKKVHAYRVVYNSAMGGTLTDHLYTLENKDQINIVQPEGKTQKHICVIVDSDTFKLENGKGVLK